MPPRSNSAKRPTARRGIQLPRLGPLTAVETLPGERLADDAGYTQLSLSNSRLAGQSASAIRVEQSVFKQVNWSQTSLSAPRLADVRFDGCDLAGADWQSARLARVEFVDCRLLGFKLQQPELRDVLWKTCNMEYAVCWSGSVKSARFEQCVLRAASFEGTDLSGVVFRNCDLSGADFRGATLGGADLRGSTLAGLQVGLAELRGAIIDPSQTASVAGLLGVIVQWPDEA